MGGVMGDESRLSSRNANLEDSKAICLQSPNGELRDGGGRTMNSFTFPASWPMFMSKIAPSGVLLFGNTPVPGRRAPAC